MDQLITPILSQRTNYAAERTAFENLLARFGDWSGVAEANAYLRELPGVGPKSATFVQLFSMRRPVLPVDTHVHRTTRRVGIIEPKVTEAKAHDVLLAKLPPDAAEILNSHKLWFKLGQRVCRYRLPACERCPLRADCDHARAREPPAGTSATEAARNVSEQLAMR